MLPYSIKWILHASKLVEDVTIEFYTSILSMSMAMYIKNSEKGTLEEAFQEPLKFEKNMMSLKGSSKSKPFVMLVLSLGWEKQQHLHA